MRQLQKQAREMLADLFFSGLCCLVVLATGLFERGAPDPRSAVWRGGFVYRVDADEVNPEVPQLVEERVELGMVGEVPSQ